MSTDNTLSHLALRKLGSQWSTVVQHPKGLVSVSQSAGRPASHPALQALAAELAKCF